MEKKHAAWAGVVVVIIAAVIGWPHLSWFRFRLEANGAIGDKKLGRFPSPDQIKAFPGVLKGLAKEKGFDDLSVKLSLFEEKQAGTVTWWFLRANLSSGSHKLVIQRRVESKFGDGDLEDMKESGVEVKEL